MDFNKFLFTLLAACTLFNNAATAQDRPIGYWRSFLPYNSAIGIATDGNTIYTVSEQAFYVFNTLNGQMDGYSKVEGMSDIGMQGIGYDMATSTAVLAYSNGNIDLFKDNTFYNIPELKIKTIAGAKTIFGVYTFNGYAYLSTSIGIIVLDLTKKNVKETYEFVINNQIVPIKGFCAVNDYFYAATTKGVFRANRNSPELQNFQAWQIIDSSRSYTGIAGFDNEVFASTTTAVFRVVSDTLSQVYHSPYGIEHIDASSNSLHICEYDTATFNGFIHTYSAGVGISDSLKLPAHDPLQVIQTIDGKMWIADRFGGAMRREKNNDLGYFTPSGPLNPNSFDLYAHNKSIWVAHGGYNDLFEPSQQSAGMVNFSDEHWKYYTSALYKPFDSVTDVCVLYKDENSGILYAGSHRNGLFVLNPDGTTQIYNKNSIFDPSRSLGLTTDYRQVVGIGMDSRKNLWVTTMYSAHPLYVKTPDNEWYKFKFPSIENGGPIVVDDDDNIWFVGFKGDGVNVYNTSGTISNQADDTYTHMGMGKGFGNLPSNTVNCIAKDLNNNIWVGTPNGIGILNNCSAPFDPNRPCDAEIPIVQYDQYAGYLFAGNNVRALAVDGANRKLVGTDEGVWLLSSDASKIIYRFTTENSPLPSDHIQKIAIDNATGDVYIGTEKGIISYRSTATEGGTSNSDVLVFPNPVPSGYSGTVAIKGLVKNGDVRITDVSGQLVYRTKALGGQAVWNGLDYTGHKPQSGVYLIFASDATGTETYRGKVVFLK